MQRNAHRALSFRAKDISDTLGIVMRSQRRFGIITKEQLEKIIAERTGSLREVIAQMEEFSYSVSHDLRSPLAAAKASAAKNRSAASRPK